MIRRAPHRLRVQPSEAEAWKFNDEHENHVPGPKLTRCRLGCGALLLPREEDVHVCQRLTVGDLAGSRRGEWP